MGEFDRNDIKFDSGDSFCAGWLYRPTDVERPPAIVLCHGLGAVREMRLDAFAERFAAEGFAVLAFTYRHFGDSGGEPRQLLDIGKELDDIAAALAYVRSLGDVDADRVALWGSSFGGGNVIEAGARDGKLTAVVAQCPFTDGTASGLTLGLTSTAKITVKALSDKIGGWVGRDPVYAQLSGTRGDAAMMTAHDVVEGYNAIQPEGIDVDNRVAARVALDILKYRPGKSLKKLTCPTLVCVCEKDTVAPAKAAIKFVEQAGDNVELKTYPVGHFDIYLGEPFEKIVADQLEFFQRTLAPQAALAS
jgi:pimeloyl-ACP methyl ester carboxylesterase